MLTSISPSLSFITDIIDLLACTFSSSRPRIEKRLAFDEKIKSPKIKMWSTVLVVVPKFLSTRPLMSVKILLKSKRDSPFSLDPLKVTEVRLKWTITYFKFVVATRKGLPKALVKLYSEKEEITNSVWYSPVAEE